MELKVVIAIVLISGVSVAAGLFLLCYTLCRDKKRPTWQPRVHPTSEFEYIPISTIPRNSSIFPIQPPATGKKGPTNTPDSGKLSTIDEREEQITPLRTQPPRDTYPPQPYQSNPHPLQGLQQRQTKQDLEIAKRYADGKVAELEMWILYRNNVLEITIRKIEKIHESINKKAAYVRVRNPRERKISIPMLRYSNSFQALLGSHSFKFSLTSEQLQTTAFRFYLWSVDKHSRQKEFGEFALDFKEVVKTRDLVAGYTDKFDFMVYDTQPQVNDPSIRLRLKYHSKSAKMIVSVLEIRDLQKNNWALIPTGIYVKVIFTNNQSRHTQEYRTKHVKGAHPQLHTTFNHKVLIKEMEETTMSVQIKAKIVHTETLSVLEFSSNATGRLGEHWMQMIQGISAGYGVEMTHRISQEKRKVNPIARRISTTAFY